MDGITYLVYSEQEYQMAERICEVWSTESLYTLEETEYDLYVRLNVNNYMARKVDPKGKLDEKDLFKYKGLFEPEINYMKSLRGPVLSTAFKNYFVRGVSVEETINNHKNIEDFMFTKKSDRKFDVEYYLNGELQGIEQNVFRYFLSKNPYKIYTKVEQKNKKYVANQVDLFESSDSEVGATKINRKILSKEYNTEMLNFLDLDHMTRNVDRRQYISYVNGFLADMFKETQKYSILFN